MYAHAGPSSLSSLACESSYQNDRLNPLYSDDFPMHMSSLHDRVPAGSSNRQGVNQYFGKKSIANFIIFHPDLLYLSCVMNVSKTYM